MELIELLDKRGIEYKKTNNPLFLWSVYRLCRDENIAIPEWVYEYFDKYALHGTINK